MAVVLEGGCRVTEMREGTPFETGTLKMWSHVGRDVGAQAISLRILEFSYGVSQSIRNVECDEVLFVAEGNGTLFIDGRPYEVTSGTGIYLRPHQRLTVENTNSDPLVLVSSQCPEPSIPAEIGAPITDPLPQSTQPVKPPLVRLEDREAVPTADRWYRILTDKDMGSAQVTQFVGSIPPGRSPDHYHDYEEVLFIISGSGRMWTGNAHTPIERGSCIYLPKGQSHCVENTGADELRLLGVFYPAGSPDDRKGD